MRRGGHDHEVEAALVRESRTEGSHDAALAVGTRSDTNTRLGVASDARLANRQGHPANRCRRGLVPRRAGLVGCMRAAREASERSIMSSLMDSKAETSDPLGSSHPDFCSRSTASLSRPCDPTARAATVRKRAVGRSMPRKHEIFRPQKPSAHVVEPSGQAPDSSAILDSPS